MDIVGLITARGGSKGIPGKNIKMLAGKPMIAWTIEAAWQSRQLQRVIVSTDDPEIARVAGQWGAEVPFRRPPELALDDTPHVAVVEHALGWLEANLSLKPEYLMLLQPTSPLRTADDIAATVKIAEEHRAEAVVSLSAMEPHPYLAKRLLADGTFVDFIPHEIAYPRRQDLPQVYALNGAIYLNRRESLLQTRTFCPPGAFAYIMPVERSLDIDSPWDFHLAELILKDQNEAKPH